MSVNPQVALFRDQLTCRLYVVVIFERQSLEACLGSFRIPEDLTDLA
jgi:hypothetical protein